MLLRAVPLQHAQILDQLSADTQQHLTHCRLKLWGRTQLLESRICSTAFRLPCSASALNLQLILTCEMTLPPNSLLVRSMSCAISAAYALLVRVNGQLKQGLPLCAKHCKHAWCPMLHQQAAHL